MKQDLFTTSASHSGPTTAPDPLNALLASRFGGAVNVRGIRFQLLYSLLRALDLNELSDSEFMRIEGIEDLDLNTVQFANQYIQIKTAQSPWHWSQLKKPIKSFAEIHVLDRKAQFLMVFDIKPHDEIIRLGDYAKLSKKEQKRVRTKFILLCNEIGTPAKIAEDLLPRISVTSESEERVTQNIRRRVADRFTLGSRSIDVYIHALMGRMLDWSTTRATVRWRDLATIGSQIGEALAREANFQAIGRGLIARIEWTTGDQRDDFLEGRTTRPAHIAANLDIERPQWIARISRALSKNKVCILRSPSGQGKSTLLFRFARNTWSGDMTFILRAVTTEEQAASVSEYIRLQRSLGVTPLLIIDSIDWQTRYWVQIAEACTEAGGQIIAAIRTEDWHRFGNPAILGGYEILEPTLEQDEAVRIYAMFQEAGRLHKSVDSALWAYERIGKPPMLMEYVYFLTHGTMLEERLTLQLRTITKQGEDPAKIDILRRVSLASVMGIPLIVENLVSNIHFRDDPQHVLQSLDGEYVSFDGQFIAGLHHVRSEHLARILHLSFPNPAQTAVRTFSAVAPEHLPTFIAGVFGYPGVDRARLLAGLTAANGGDRVLLGVYILDGLFRAGEQDFFNGNRSLFDEAYDLNGNVGVSFLSYHLLPVIKITDALHRLETTAEESNFTPIRKIAEQTRNVERGLDLCKQFLNLYCPTLSAEDLGKSAAHTGTLLDWCALCEVQISAWSEARAAVFRDARIYELDIDSFCSISQGFYRHGERFYRDWFAINRDTVIGYLKLRTKSVQLTLVADNTLEREFLVLDSATAAHDNMRCLEQLRSALPFCATYKSKGIWPLPSGVELPYDDTLKSIPHEAIPLVTDAKKNKTFIDIAMKTYVNPDSFYRYHEIWYGARCAALDAIEATNAQLERMYCGQVVTDEQARDLLRDLVHLERRLLRLPELPSRAGDDMCTQVNRETHQWASRMRPVFIHLFRSNGDGRRFALLNCKQALEALPSFHRAFDSVLSISPDYFSCTALNAREQVSLSILSDVLDMATNNPPKHRILDIGAYVRVWRAQQKKESLNALRETISAATDAGLRVIAPRDVPKADPYGNRYWPVAFEVDDPLDYQNELGLIMGALSQLNDPNSVFYLIPLFNGRRFLDGAYQFSVDQLRQMCTGETLAWTSLVPLPIPDEALRLLSITSAGLLPEFLILVRDQAALVSSMKELHRLVVSIEPLRLSEDRFDAELYTAIMNDLRPRILTIRQRAISLIQVLSSASSLQTTGVLHLVLLVNSAIERGTFSSDLLAGAFDLDRFETDCDVIVREMRSVQHECPSDLTSF